MTSVERFALEVPLVQLLAEELGWDPSRVTLEHDTNAALLAEAQRC